MLRIHSKLILDHPESSTTWYLLRSLDGAGSGWVCTSRSVLASALGISKRALKRRLEVMLRDGFLYSYEISGDKLWVKYAGIARLKAQSGGVLASALVQTKVLLSVATAKKEAYAAAISRLQETCRRAIGKKVTNSKAIFEPSLRADGSIYATGCVHVEAGKKFFVKLGRACVGASQITLANSLDKARSTIGRWCQKFDSVQVWKRQKLCDNPLPDVYQTYKIVRRKGKPVKVREQYKRMPNYYFVDTQGRRERREEFRDTQTAATIEQRKRSEDMSRWETIMMIVKNQPKPIKRKVTKVDRITKEYYKERDRLLFMTLKQFEQHLDQTYTHAALANLVVIWFKVIHGKDFVVEQALGLTKARLCHHLAHMFKDPNHLWDNLFDRSLHAIKNSELDLYAYIQEELLIEELQPIYPCGWVSRVRERLDAWLQTRANSTKTSANSISLP